MDFNELDKSPHMTPLLVHLYDSHKLYNLAKDTNPLARAELTRAVTDLFERELNAKEQELLADVLIALMRQAERDLRQALSERLSVFDNVPLRLVLHLANDEITVAAPVLRKSDVLSDLDLIYIIKSKGPDYWQAIAARERLSDEVVDILANTGDIGTALVLTQNDRIKLTRHAMTILGEIAKDNELIARPLIMREEMPESLVKKLYDHVGQELKDYIRAFFNFERHDFNGAVDDLVLAFTERAPEPKYLPTDHMIRLSKDRASKKLLNMDVMMETLDKGEIAEFISHFAVYTDISARKIHDFLCQSCPKGMAIACRAFRVQKNDFAKIYLLTHKMRSKHRMVNQKDMLELLQYFDKVRPEVATRIVRRDTSNA